MRSLFATVSIALAVTVAGGVALLAAAPQQPQPRWHITATVAESCSCAVSCSCNFGGNPNRMPCEGNRLISINKGHYDGVDLSGVAFLVTFEMRKWTKIYVSDRISDAQNRAVEALLPVAFAGFRNGMLLLQKGAISVDLSETRVRFSGPESAVDMEVMKGFGDKPVKILNLPNPAYQDYTQFKSITHTHKGGGHAWSHSGTNGFTSTMDVGNDR